MTKTSRYKRPGSAPLPDQMNAVRRLADAGNLIQARQRLAALRRAFPDFKPLLGLAWEIESLAGEPLSAAARAWDWQLASPKSRAALEALADSAGEAGMAAVTLRAVQRLSSLEPGQALPQQPEPIDTPFGPLTFEQAEAIDLSLMHLNDDNPGAAAAVLRGVEHPSARNNLALALFGSGDVQQAQAVAEGAWTAQPDNLFALERALRWRCWAQGMERCAGFGATLRAAVPRRAEDANSRVAALRFLGDTEAARAAWEEVRDQDYWDHAAPEQVDLFDDLREPDADVPGEHSLWFPRPWENDIAQLARDSKAASEAAVAPLWHAKLDACDAHADYLQRACELGDDAVRMLALAVLKRRAKLTEPDAAAALAAITGLLVSLRGPDAQRMHLLNWLNEEGLRDPAAAARVLSAGKVREIKFVGMHITAEPRPSPFSAEGTLLAQRMHRALGRRELDEAFELALQLRAMHPDQPAALTNLANIGQALGKPLQESIRLHRESLALAPDYLFARCALARHLAGEGQLDEARALLEGVFEREQWHFSEYRSFLLAQRALALAQGEHQAMRAVDETLLEIERRFGA